MEIFRVLFVLRAEKKERIHFLIFYLFLNKYLKYLVILKKNLNFNFNFIKRNNIKYINLKCLSFYYNIKN
jgi:hypothetical protein